MKKVIIKLAIFAVLFGTLPAMAATPPNGTVSEGTPTVMWTGAPATSNPATCDPSSCDSFFLTIVAPSYTPYKVIIEMDATGASAGTDDYDMEVLTPSGDSAGTSGSSGSNEKIALFNPPPGTYEVIVWSFATAPGATYGASALMINAQEAPLVAVAPTNERSIFATPTLMDSQLHTGEPSIDVSPVLPTDGSRPLVIGDAPWGTSNATSLWWRSRDGAHSFELVQDPVAAPRPRPCEEIDGGGDSDTVIDKNGQIYVNDLAALINITVGHSSDDFQTMSCTKVDGTNPLQPIQDRQWIVASPFADGTGPNTDAFITFRRGLIGGTPLTETAIQIYETKDAGATYDPVGEIVDFFGFSNNKVSQTGNPVVDPIDGTLYQAYYLGSVAKVGRYDPVANTFEALTVASRDSDVGNVFTTMAIDTAGNLYYGWIEGGSFDVHIAVSTDRGDTWSSPVKVSLPGDSDLAVNPYMIAGSPGRVAILYNATADAPSPDGADGQVWHLYLSQSINALDPNPVYTQYQVTDTPLHFNAICTSGLGCNLSVPEGDRSLLEFNEVDIDESDGSMVFIFADNGRHAQLPVDAATEIPQPYIMSTRQIAGHSMLAGKTINNTLPRMTQVTDPIGDATYPKAGTTEGPNYPSMDLLGSSLSSTANGIRATLNVADLSDLNAALGVTYGVGDPRLTQKVLWLTRFEVVYQAAVARGVSSKGARKGRASISKGATSTREEVYNIGMEFKLGDLNPTCFYGPVGVSRNGSGSIKRSDYAASYGTIATCSVIGNSILVDMPYSAMGIDPALNPHPAFRSVVGFALAQPDAELEGMAVESYFNNQRTVDATRAYDWSPNDLDIDGIADGNDNCPLTFNPIQADFDVDGVGDACDNCSQKSNADQCDTNADGFGNLCDADLNNDNIVNSSDLSLMRSSFGNSGVIDSDLNCDNITNSSDLSIMRGQFGSPPGPSGLVQ